MSENRKLVTTVYVGGVAYGPDSDVPSDVAELITNPKAWGDDPSTADRATNKPPTKAEMKAEIDRRNADRDDEHKIVPASDKNDDLAAAIKADDEAGDN